MKTFQFCINNDCRIACQADCESNAWEWLAKTKSLSVEQVKKLYIIKTK